MAKAYDIPLADFDSIQAELAQYNYTLGNKSGVKNLILDSDLESLTAAKLIENDTAPNGDSLPHDVTPDYLFNKLFAADAITYLTPHDTGILMEVPKICALYKGDMFSKHFHSMNYKTELSSNLYPKMTFSFGALTNVKWYSDEALTDIVLNVDVTYNYDVLGFATDRTVVRTWFMINDEAHPEDKVTFKNYTINPQGQLDEAILRRTNNLRQTNLWLIGAVPGLTILDPLITDVTLLEVRDDGVAFFEAHEMKSNVYVETGSLQLEQAVIDDVTLAWAGTVYNAALGAPTGVSDVRDFVIYQLSNGARNAAGTI